MYNEENDRRQSELGEFLEYQHKELEHTKMIKEVLEDIDDAVDLLKAIIKKKLARLTHVTRQTPSSKEHEA